MIRNVSGIEVFAFLNCHNVQFGHIAVLENPPVIFTRLHENGKARHLRSAVVNVQTIEIFLQDQPGEITACVTPLQIYLFENIIGLHQNMAGAAGGIRNVISSGCSVAGVMALIWAVTSSVCSAVQYSIPSDAAKAIADKWPATLRPRLFCTMYLTIHLGVKSCVAAGISSLLTTEPMT